MGQILKWFQKNCTHIESLFIESIHWSSFHNGSQSKDGYKELHVALQIFFLLLFSTQRKCFGQEVGLCTTDERRQNSPSLYMGIVDANGRCLALESSMFHEIEILMLMPFLCCHARTHQVTHVFPLDVPQHSCISSWVMTPRYRISMEYARICCMWLR